MKAQTHLVAGAGAAVIFLTAVANQDFGAPELTLAQQMLSVPICLAGSLFPDIDLRTSVMGRKVQPVSCLVSALFGHRTLFHSPLLMAIIYLMGKTAAPNYMWVVLSFLVGMFSHLVMDALNRQGVPLLWPIPTRFWAASIKTGSKGETRFTVFLSAIVIAMCIQYARLFVPNFS